MKYDDASWHYGGDFPKDLAPEAGATHTGMFVAWCMLNGLASELHVDEFPDLLRELKVRTLTPASYFIKACDEKFTDEDLSEEGNSFAKAYFDFDKGEYLGDYEATFSLSGQDLYRVPDTWESFDRLAPLIRKRYDEWKNGG